MSVSSGWIQLTTQEKRQKPFFYYRRQEIYPQLQWSPSNLKELDFNLDISQLCVAIAPFGGPIAFTKDIIKGDLYIQRPDVANSQIVRIYTSSGLHLASFNVSFF